MKLYVLILIIVLVLTLAGCNAPEYSVVATVSADRTPNSAEPFAPAPLPHPTEAPETLDGWIAP